MSEPFGHCSEDVTHWFDDFDLLMPYMMNPKTQNSFDRHRAVKISEIRFLLKDKAIIGMKTIYEFSN